MKDLDIPVNAVATALKDYVSKKLPSLIPSALMEELYQISNIDNHAERLIFLKHLIAKLPVANFYVLKYVCAHFVR